MDATSLVRHLTTPTTMLTSLWLSARHAPRRLAHLPIVASRRTRIKRSRGSRLTIHGRLVLGWFFTRLGEIGQIALDPTVVQLGKGSELCTYGRVILGPGVRVIVGDGAKVTIGAGTFISSNSKVLCKQQIDIGEHCAISWDVQIMDTDFHTVVVDGQPRRNTAAVKIGNRVWIGSKVTILKGVTIGDGAVIAAGSLVTRDVPPRCLVAGNPARVVRDEIDWIL